MGLSFSVNAKNEKAKNNRTFSVYMDNTHRFITDGWSGFNDNMDIFFSSETHKKERDRSLIMAYYGVEKTEGQKQTYNFDIKIRVDLSRTAKKLKIVIEKERDDIFEATSSAAERARNNALDNSSDAAKGKNYTAGISYLLFKSDYFVTNFDLGMKILMPLDPFTKLRLYRGFENRYFNTELSQSFILYRQNGFSEVTSLNFSKRLSSKYHLGQGNAISWTDEDDDFNIRHGLTLNHSFSDTKLLRYGIGANAVLSPTYYYTGYDAAISLKQLLYKKWLFANMTYGMNFYKSDNFDITHFAQFRVEIYFK